MPNACNVPTSGSDSGKYSLAKTSGATSTYSRKSYASITVPTVEATTARRNCRLCSASDRPGTAVAADVIGFPPVHCALSAAGKAPRALFDGSILTVTTAREQHRFALLSGSLQHANDRTAHAGRDGAGEDRTRPERDDFAPSLRHHCAHAANQDAEAAEIGKAAQRIGHDQPRM